MRKCCNVIVPIKLSFLRKESGYYSFFSFSRFVTTELLVPEAT